MKWSACALCINSIKKRFNWWWQSTEYSMSVARQFVGVFLLQINRQFSYLYFELVVFMSVSMWLKSVHTAASIIWRIFHWIRWMCSGSSGGGGGDGCGSNRNGMGSNNNGNRGHNVCVTVSIRFTLVRNIVNGIHTKYAFEKLIHKSTARH